MKDETTKLNELRSYCQSAQKGYDTAAEQVDDPILRALFEKYSRRHGEFAYDISQQLLVQGEDPENQPNIAAGAHRIWINIKGLLTAKNARAILRECLRGEQEAVEHYQTTLDSYPFSNNTRLLLAGQLKEIELIRADLERRIEN